MDLFSRFWEVRMTIFGYFGDPGAHFGGPGAHPGGPGPLFGEPGPQFEDFWNYYDFGCRSGTKKDTHFASNFDKFTTCCSVIFLCFFECLLFRFFVILGARRLHFSINFEVILRVLELWKNLQNCVTVINFRGLALSRYSLFASLDCGCVLIVIFSDVCDF